MTAPYIIPVPNILCDACIDVEAFYTAVTAAPEAALYKFDLKAVSFVRPYGVLAIFNAARLLHHRCRQPIELVNIAPTVHTYLERVDLFRKGSSILFCATEPAELYSRSSCSLSVLEISFAIDSDSLDAITTRANSIFTANLGKATASLIVLVLSELCANMFLHSRDRSGVVMIQRCLAPGKPNFACVRVVVGDLGIGIRRSLMKKHSQFDTPQSALEAVFQGYSSSRENRTGKGIRSVAKVAKEHGGYIWLRTETASILHNSVSSRTFSDLCFLPGTQVGVEFQAPPRVLTVDASTFIL